MSLSICPRCQYRFPPEQARCPECHFRMDGTEKQAEERRTAPRNEASTGPYCPYCGSNRIHKARGLEGFKEYLALAGLVLLCFALGWIIPVLIMVPVAGYYLYFRSCPHCLNCDRRNLQTVDRYIPPTDRTS